MKRSLPTISSTLALVALCGLGACASITSMQGAQTLKAGESKSTVGFGYSNLKLKVDDASESTKVPSIDYLGRYGITDQDEVGVRVSNFGAYIEGDYKRAVIQDSGMNLSVGAGIGGTKFESGSSSTTIVDLYVPVYVDFPLGNMLTLITSPKFIYRTVSADGEMNGTPQVGLSGGVKLGESAGVMMEVAYTKELKNEKANYWQLMGSFFF